MYTYVVIDDERLIRKGIIKKLSPLDDIVTCVGEAANGREALERIRLCDPDIIITDMNMPVLDGTEFLPALTESFPKKQIIIISGYKDFEYMKHAISAKAIEYILKPFSKEELHKAVKKAIRSLEAVESVQQQLISTAAEKETTYYEYDMQILKNLLQGYHTETTTLTSQRLQFINKTYNLLLITIHSRTPLSAEDFESYLEENGFGDLALYLPHMHTSNLGFFVLFVPEHSSIRIQDFCRQIVRSLSERLSQNQLHFGISGEHTSLLDLHDAYAETVGALNTIRPADTANYYFYAENKLAPIPIEWEHADEFLFRVEMGELEKMQKLLDQFFTYVSLENYTLSDIKYYCFGLANQAKSVMTQYFSQLVQDSVSGSMQNILNGVFTLEEIKDYYLQFYGNIAKMLKDRSVYATDDVIEKFQTYVQRNYQKNTSLEFLSKLFYMNRSYCSHLFHQRTGMKYIDYVNRIRIQRAKELLETTSKKPYQIAKAVGYDNAKYFFRVFKRETGISPLKYREYKENS